MISLSDLFKEAKPLPTKTIKVKTIESLIKQKPKTTTLSDEEQLIRKKASIRKEIKRLESELNQLEERKEQLIDETEQEIKSMKAHWEKERGVYIKEAHEEGFTKGYSEGKAESFAQFKHLIDEANKIIKNAQDDYKSTVKESEPTMITLAVEIAEKIIHEQLEIDQAIIKRIATDVIKDLTDQQEINIFVSPQDYEYLLHQKKDLEQMLSTMSRLAIYVDSDLECGMCIIEYPSGKTDASIQTQLQLIEDELLNIVMEQSK